MNRDFTPEPRSYVASGTQFLRKKSTEMDTREMDDFVARFMTINNDNVSGDASDSGSGSGEETSCDKDSDEELKSCGSGGCLGEDDTDGTDSESESEQDEKAFIVYGSSKYICLGITVYGSNSLVL